MIPIVIGVGVVIIVVVAAILLLRKKPSKIAGADAYRSLLGVAQPAAAPTSDDPVINKLRQDLRVKLLYQEDKIDAAIELERERNPSASQEVLMRAAIERWERDNR